MSDERRLDPGLLEKALTQLQRALVDYDAHPEMEAYRDSVVMRFVFTYELCMQVLRRYVQLEHSKPLPDEELTTARVVRRANALGILQSEWESFVLFRDARNSVAHSYSEAKAMRVAELAASFAREAQVVLDRVKAKLND